MLLTCFAMLGTTSLALVPAPGVRRRRWSPSSTAATASGTTTVGPLAGVELGLFANTAATTPLDPGWGVCTSDANGDSQLRRPRRTQAGGANKGIRPVVRQIAAPAGWFANPRLRTGPANGSGSIDSPYAFQTPALAANRTYSSHERLHVQHEI